MRAEDFSVRVFDGHNAFLIIDELASGISFVENFLKEHFNCGLFRNNPDIYIFQGAQFRVEDAREVAARAATTGFLGAGKFFVLAAELFRLEAQNSLLKTVEDSRDGCKFFLITREVGSLLPTLKSRLLSVKMLVNADIKIEKLVDKFLEVAMVDRLEMIGEILAEAHLPESDSHLFLLNFLRTIESRVALIKKSNNKTFDGREPSLAAIKKAKLLLSQPASSSKQILEYLAVAIN